MLHDVTLYLLLLALLLTGLAITIATLPGLWLMLAAAALYAWLTHWAYIGKWTLLTLLALAFVAEVIETTSSSAGAKRAGAGRRGIWGALIGGILGAIFLSVIPIPLVAQLVGACIGACIGAAVGELSGGAAVTRSAIIGVSAAAGRLKGTLIKLGIGIVMLFTTMVAGCPHRASTRPAAANVPAALLPPQK